MTNRYRRTTPWSCDRNQAWRAARFAVVDIETTGLDLAHDEIVSVGVSVVDRGRVTDETVYRVVKPRCAISSSAMKVHALTDDEVAGAPGILEALAELRAVAAGSVLVAHAAWVERAFLNRALRSCGERVPDDLVDTAALARYAGLWPQGGDEPSLEVLSRALGLPVHTPHHALGDAVTTAQLLLVLATRIESEAKPLMAGDLLDISRIWGLSARSGRAWRLR